MITMNTLWYISCFIVGFVAGVLIEATNYNRIRKMKDRERVVRYEERIDCMEKRMRELQENGQQ